MFVPEKTYLALGDPVSDFSGRELDEHFSAALSNALGDINDSGPVIILPPDITRIHSRAGCLAGCAARAFNHSGKNRLGAVLPALGTHSAMTEAERTLMFPDIPEEKFLVHNWRNDACELGRIEADWVHAAFSGAVNFDWPVQLNRLLCKKSPEKFSLVLSIGQVVPHEVAGMANHLKNIFIGTGGKEAIDKSHFAGAVYGMEKIMGRTNTPVRALLDESYRRYAGELPPVLWVLTVVGKRTPAEAEKTGADKHSYAVRGLFVGFGRECFEKAAALSAAVNIDIMDEKIQKAVVYLDPDEYRTCWLGNKAIYRTRMALADGGELLILAPGVERFGEDIRLDALIRTYGYRSKHEIIAGTAADPELGGSLCAAAHLIHGSSEGRFTIRYCPGPNLSKKEIESVGFEWGDLKEQKARYDISRLDSGWNTINGERIFFIPNPALGLWAERSSFLEGT